ncbi:hypothetical protein GCM10011384_32830 [Psychrobacillus lasiicapitis]|nr:hypothetical protein GCM10011384_32830 [Psychrobacillus lasiicapitis]
MQDSVAFKNDFSNMDYSFFNYTSNYYKLLTNLETTIFGTHLLSNPISKMGKLCTKE